MVGEVVGMYGMVWYHHTTVAPRHLRQKKITFRGARKPRTVKEQHNTTKSGAPSKGKKVGSFGEIHLILSIL